MPDFDTRTPQEPDRPSEPRSSNQAVHIRSRWRDRITVRHRWVRTIVRYRWGLGLGLLGLLLGLSVLMYTIDWIVESPTERRDRRAREQIGQKIQTQPTTEYVEQQGGAIADDPARACDPRVDACSHVVTKATGAKKLAFITENIANIRKDYADHYTDVSIEVASVKFYDREYADRGTGFCFYDKDVAVSALRGALDQAELFGKTNGCYVAIYQGYDVPDLKPW